MAAEYVFNRSIKDAGSQATHILKFKTAIQTNPMTSIVSITGEHIGSLSRSKVGIPKFDT